MLVRSGGRVTPREMGDPLSLERRKQFVTTAVKSSREQRNERTHEGGASLMVGPRPKRARLRTAKSKRRAQMTGHNHKAFRHPGSADDDESIPVEPIHSLLLSSLKYWEVERDLIEERIAAVNH